MRINKDGVERCSGEWTKIWIDLYLDIGWLTDEIGDIETKLCILSHVPNIRRN
jgi:hypothetical protein